MPKPSFSNVVQVSIGGKVLTREHAALLAECWVDQGIGLPAAFQLTFRDPKRKILGLLRAEFGTQVRISPVAAGRGAGDPLLTGDITGLEADYDGTGSFAVIRGYDHGFRLMRQRRVVAYRNQRASDIARQLASRDGVPIGRIDPSTTLYEFISQAGVSDWDFLARLADENEMVMSIDPRGRFQFVKPEPASGAPSPTANSDASPFVLKGGVDVLRLRAAVTAADQVSQVESRGWDVTTKRRLTATSRASDNPGIAIGSSPSKATARFKPATLVETRTPYDRQDEVKHAAAALADDVTSSFAELEIAVRGTPKLRAGVPVALADVGKPFEGKYTVTSVRHDFGDGKHYEAWATVSGRQWRSLYGLASGGGGARAEGRLPGVANALVTDVQDPLKQGRVKLEFPWLDDRYVSDWTRVVQWGGKGGGGIFPLDVGDEVLVAFDRGTLDHPFVIGGLYNGQDQPTRVPDVPLHDGLRRRAARHTLSDRTGNRLDLLSQQMGAAKQGVRLKTGDDKLVINLDRAQTEITVDSDGAVSIRGGGSVSVDAGTDLTLNAGRRLRVRSGGTLDIQGRGAVTLRSLTGPVLVNAAAGLTVSTAAAINLTASGVLNATAAGAMNVTAGGVMSLKAATMPLVGFVTINGKPPLL